jgi:DnaJ-class molecular chaperone
MAQRHINLPILLSSGLQNGDVIRLPYQGDQHTQVGAGDILVELVEERVRSPNSRLLTASRPLSNERSDDLEVECSITLKEALLGFSREFYHPGSKKMIQYSSPSGKVSIPGEIYRILGQGMPRRSTNSMEYQLIVPSDEGEGGGNGGNGRDKIIEMQKKDGLEDRRLKEVQALGHRQYGDLRVRVKVQLPEKISIEQKKVIEDYL